MPTSFLLDHRYKSYPDVCSPWSADQLGERGWHVLKDDLSYPLAVLHRSSLEHNIAWMQRYAKERGLSLAPHGKTTMSPEICAMQLSAGAWGLTFATVFQTQVGIAAGASRIIIANQVLAKKDLEVLCEYQTRYPYLHIYFLVDSVSQVKLIKEWAVGVGLSKPFSVLLEIGVAGQRTGCRNLEQAIQVAESIAGSGVLKLEGIECYEGGLASGDTHKDQLAVRSMNERVLEVLRYGDSHSWFSGSEILLTAGGSAIFDLVVPLLQTQGLSRLVRGILRPGCYVTHDHGHYAKLLRGVEEREGQSSSLRSALEVWTMVQSVPEPGLALLTCGRRDISYDLSLPEPQRWAGHSEYIPRLCPAGWHISALNDQHAYLRFGGEEGAIPLVGDRISLGISHPCTTFDKWTWMPIIEDDGRVSSAIHTQF